SDSTSSDRDVFAGFNAAMDKFDLNVTVTAVDGQVAHSVSSPSLDTDLAAACSGALGTNHAITVLANAGSLINHVFIVVDANGNHAYDAGSDYVFDMGTTGITGTLTTGNFI